MEYLLCALPPAKIWKFLTFETWLRRKGGDPFSMRPKESDELIQKRKKPDGTFSLVNTPEFLW
jgi:hypothetical protein